MAERLIMAARLLDDDPELAVQHARRAYELAPRLTPAREALAITAYASGDYRTALREARAVRRMAGDEAWLPVIADCERGLGHTDRALELLLETDLERLPVETRAECLIVLSGIRRDLGQLEAALATLEHDMLRSGRKTVWSARLRLAYAEALAEAGRREEADRWLRLAVASDPDGSSGAAEVLAEWEGIEVVDTGEEH